MSNNPPNSDSSTHLKADQPQEVITQTVVHSQKADQSPPANTLSEADESQERPPLKQRFPDERPSDSTVAHPRNTNLGESPVNSIPLVERVPIQVYTEETTGQKLSHWGPTVTSVASIILTLFVWYNGQKLNEKQFELQKQQTALQNDYVQAELADMRSKFFDNLTAADETKKTLAEIGLAGHGEKAMHVIHLALGVEQSEIRQSAVNVVHRLFQAEITPEGRERLLKHLMEEFDSPNKNLRIGVVQSLVKIEPLLNPTERQQVASFLMKRIDPIKICSDQEGRDTVHEAAMFISSKSPDPTAYLLAVAQCPRCGNGWLQAMLKLGTTAGKLSPPSRIDLQKRIVELLRRSKG